MTRLDHIEPNPVPDKPNFPPPPPPAPAPDVIPVRDPELPEHPDPVREPPTDRPPVSTSFEPSHAPRWSWVHVGAVAQRSGRTWRRAPIEHERGTVRARIDTLMSTAS